MPPQSNDIISVECGSEDEDCNHNDNCNTSFAEIDLTMFLSKPSSLDVTFETESTSDTTADYEISRRKDSFSSEDDTELGTPVSFFSRRVSYVLPLNDCSTGWSRLRTRSPYGDICGRSFFGKRERAKTGPIHYIASAFAFCVFSLGVVAIASTMLEDKNFATWNKYLLRDSPKIFEEIQRIPVGETVTVRVKGRRLDLLQQSIDAHSRCSSVEEIQIEYNGENAMPLSLFKHGAGKAATVGEVSTAGILLLNEGIILSCEELDRTFKAWKRDPARIVGFFGYSGNGAYDKNLSSTNGPYSVVSDRAAFVHTAYLKSLANVSTGSDCDSLLSMQVSIISRKAPLLMKTRPLELLQQGLNSHHENSCSKDWLHLLYFEHLPNSNSLVLG